MGNFSRIRDYLNPTLGSLTGLFLVFRSPGRLDYAICWALMWQGTIANCTGWPLIMLWLLLNYVPLQITSPLIYFWTVSRLVIVPSPRALLQLRPCACRYPLIFTLWYTKIKGQHKTGKLKTGKNICKAFQNKKGNSTFPFLFLTLGKTCSLGKNDAKIIKNNKNHAYKWYLLTNVCLFCI